MTTKRNIAGVMGLVLLVSISGCSRVSQVSELEEQNKALVRHVHAEIAKGNLTVLNDVLTPDYTRHCQAMPPGLQELHGVEQFMPFLENFYGAVSNFHETIDLMIAEGDLVAYITTMSGTQTGEMGGLPASGKDFTIINFIVQRFEQGKIAETWVSWDNVAMLTQLGYFPPPPPPTSQP